MGIKYFCDNDSCNKSIGYEHIHVILNNYKISGFDKDKIPAPLTNFKKEYYFCNSKCMKEKINKDLL